MGAQQKQMHTQTPPMRINWRRLGVRLFITLILPVLFALLVDRLLATSPFVTMVIALICIPVATFVVLRTALLELDRVIEKVAPLEQTAEQTIDDKDDKDDKTDDKTVSKTDSVTDGKIEDTVPATDKGNGAPDATN